MVFKRNRIQNNINIIKRILYVIIFFVCIFFIILIKIFFLQFFYNDFYKEKSIKNFTRYKEIDGLRGEILDCNGKVIASTRPVLRLLWKKRPYKFSDEDDEILNFINEYLGFDVKKEELLSKDLSSYFVIKNEIGYKELSLIFEKFSSSKRLSVEIYSIRHYPNKYFACHVIGYLHRQRNIGMTGIEKIYNQALEGTKGLEKFIVDSCGNVIDSKIIKDSILGSNLITTIDIDIQNIIEDIFKDGVIGSALVMDPENGALKAIVSSPRFDLEMFQNSISKEQIQELNENNSWINRCFYVTYPPGSIFKMLSAIAMLEEKLINLNTNWFCCGYSEYKNRKYHCHLEDGHGSVNIKSALYHSCNIPFFEASKSNLTIDIINKYAKIFGFGERTGSIFNEKDGLVPSRKWKKKTFNESWYRGETLSVSIGQGALLATPIQIARFIGAIMTGNLVKPRIIENEKIEKKQITVSNNTLSIIRDSISLGVKQGTSRQLNTLKEWDIYAKTGTAQLVSRKNEDDLDKSLHGLIACYAKYRNNRPFVLVIVIENKGSGKLAVLYAKEFLKKYAKLNK